ncbi:alpha/beta fold hydrolase [Microbacterium sp. B19]|uniref:alpha/beta fold hydrolase n=1 Tax=Microbacterium sp. B19 TaxID=96765 RepID=UPI0016510CE5|nr:alpha/beta hydrolase [Microbacterium sp. B19]
MPYIDLADGGRLFFTEEGAGRPVLLIHGWACDGSDWAWLQADLAADHRAIAIDNRGHGRSSRSETYSPAAFAADAAEVIERLELGPTLVMGHSMGTIIASALAIRRPELVSGLVLVDPVYGADPAVMAGALRMARADPHGFTVAAWAPFYGARTPAWLPIWHRRRTLATDPHTVSEALAGLYEGEGGLGLASVGERELVKRQAPTLALYAGTGQAIADWDGALEHRAPYEIEIWPENGHFLHQEDPERFAARVRSWLAASEV